ncbi:NRAMP family divalent metal transporter [Thermoplasma sp.]|uniref:NRAMP family divalent metal transporter n=1 Tax=Thermoplasma sp. TaxID=1973142 RepID=UPI0012848BE7|nr:NRAMP family divalent metal transporter [Thermoplasma sp.]KAA8923386.1 MAG: divalent metal cation transporter [Thermoplasma sp.]
MNFEIAKPVNIHRIMSRIGPAWIVMMADVDVASVITGLQSGAAFGYRMIFIMIILIPPLFIVQNAAGYLGIFSGMGMGEAVRTRYGRKLAMIASVPMASTDVLSYIAEYSGMAIGLSMIGIPPLISIPVIFAIHNAIIMVGRYHRIERVLLLISLVLVVSIISSAVMMKPSLLSIIRIGLNPIQPYTNRQYETLLIANIGAVIMPFMIFYQAGASVQKHMGKEDIRISRNETAIGSAVSEFLMVMTVIAGAFIGGYATDPALLDRALKPFGSLAPYIMATGFFTAGFLALIVISLASTWGIAEALGWKFHRHGRYLLKNEDLDSDERESLKHNMMSDRKKFLMLYMTESIPAAVIAIVASSYLLSLVIDLMIVFVIVLAPVGLLLGLLVSDSRVMKGNPMKRWYMVVYWVTLAIIESAGVYSLITSI